MWETHIYSQTNDLPDTATIRESGVCRWKKKEHKALIRNALNSQSRLNLVDGGDTIRTVSVGDGGVLLGGIIAKQEHLLAVQGVSWPIDIRQQADGGRTVRMVGVLVVDEVHWRGL